MTEDGLSFSKCSYVSEVEFEKAKKVAACPEPGTVLFSKDGTVGKVHVVSHERPFAALSSIAILRPDRERLDSQFLGFALGNPAILRDAVNRKTGSALQRIILADLKEVGIPLPALPDQRRIVEQLEQAYRLRRTRRFAIELTDTFLPAAFCEIFGDSRTNSKHWDNATMGELLIQGPQNGIYKPASAYGAGTPILRIDAFYDGAVTEIASLKRVKLSPNEIESFGLSENDIVINRVNSRPYLGKSAIIPKLNEPTVFESNMMRFTLNSKCTHPIYVTHYLQTPFVKSQIQVLGKDAVNQSSINQEDVKGLIVRLPPLPLQQKFAALVERVERLRAVQRESLRQAEHLFATLLHRAFQVE
jgi:type I restriction enzyme, S subunit